MRRPSSRLLGLAPAVALMMVTGVLAGGCATERPTGSPAAAASPIPGPPTPAPAFGLTWAQVEDVERPADAFASALPTAPTGPGTAGHPGHFPGQSILADVAVRDDLLVAVGFTYVDGAWTADAWTSSDALHWALSTVDTRPFSFATGVAISPAGGFVAVGRVGAEPAAWTSPDGRTWSPGHVERLDLASGRLPERIETVLATEEGLIAGGSAGPELGDRRARFWRSDDGTAWTAVTDNGAFTGAEVVDIAWAAARGYVAVGRLGTGQRATSSVAWTSVGGATWTRSDDQALASGLVAAVVPGWEEGWLAVGSDGDEREAVAWSSADGVRRSRGPRQTA